MTPTAPVIGADRIAYGPVHLDVTEAERSLAFWRDLIGLTEVGRERDAVHLGAGGQGLVVLHPGAARGARRGHRGLYHVALHLPDAAEFARVVARLATLRVPQSPTDHIFSMATYLHDPDGLMLEITLETPERFAGFEITPQRVVMRDADGRLRGPTEPLDVQAVFTHLPDRALTEPVAEGAFIGHVHLHVPDLRAAVAFYRDAVGFDEHMVMASIGMADLSAGGRFPHRIALNDWNGPGATPPPPGTAGLRHVELILAGDGALPALGERLEGVGARHEPAPDGVWTADPAGTRLLLRAA
ncbi:MAG: VOC family protein [Thermoleophilia bacterium]|jgi:catechol 2,3-dioxygenase|nr:VOC family protein [Thermoleophilia bacterium]